MKKNEMIKGTMIYTGSNLIIKLGAFIVLPLMTRLLTETQFGILGVLSPFTSIFTTIIGFGFYNVIMKKYAVLRENKKEFGIYKFSILSFILLVDLVIILIFLTPISKIIFSYIIDIDYRLIFISVLISMVNTFNNIALSLFRMERKYFKVALGSLISFFTTYILTFYFIINLNLGLIGTQLANLLAVIILMFYLYVDYLKDIEFKIKRSYITYSLMGGIPLIFIELTDLLVNFSDRYILAKFNISYAIIAAYTLAYTGARAISVISNSFVNAWTPVLYENIYDDSVHRKLENYLSFLTIICIFAVLFCKEAIFLLFPNHYMQAIPYMPVVLATTLMQALYALDFYFHYFDKSKYIILFTLTALVTNVVLNIIFIPIFYSKAVFVAASTTLISMSLRAVIEFLFIKKMFKIRFNYLKIFIYFILIFNPLIFYFINLNIGIYSISIKLIYLLLIALFVLKRGKNV